MHTINHARGHKRFDTMTVAELIKALATYPTDMPVLATWESTINAVVVADYPTEIEHLNETDCLVIQAETFG